MHTVGEAVAEGGGNRWAANTVGGEVTGASKVAVAAVWRGHHGPNAVGPWFWLGGRQVGPGGFDIFPNYPNRFKFGNWKRMPYPAPKIPKFRMLLDWGIMNNSLNCADMQFSIELVLQILEQIHHFNFSEFLKGFNSSRKIF
jgi:hypothetical protein